MAVWYEQTVFLLTMMPVPDMTYNVFCGTLNLNQSIYQSDNDADCQLSAVAAPGRQGSQVISRSLRSWRRSSDANASAVKEPGQKARSPDAPESFLKSWKKLTTFFVVALKTKVATAADCFTVKIKQSRPWRARKLWARLEKYAH